MSGATARSIVRSRSSRMRRRTLRRDESLRQFRRFLLVGVGNTAVSFVVYRLLLAVGTPYVLAAALGFAVGAVNGYVFNRRWTFGARDSARARFLYVAVQAVGAASTSLLVLLFVAAAGAGKVGAYLAAIPLVTVCMFMANRVWTFADRN
jgi:putative flippase GtrA